MKPGKLQEISKHILLKAFKDIGLWKDGNILPHKIALSIDSLISYNHKTFRYMLFTGLLAKMADFSLHPRSLQAGANLAGAYDARSLCHEVVVKFEGEYLSGKIGNSSEPFLNKPARYPEISLNNPVRNGGDRIHLKMLYEVLEYANTAKRECVNEMFMLTFYKIMQRPPQVVSEVSPIESNISLCSFHKIIDTFLNQSHEGQSAVSVYAAFLKIIYPNVKVHPANECGASSNQVGDIDIMSNNSCVSCAIEVKDKDFSESEVNFAVKKAVGKNCARIIFAYGRHARNHPEDFTNIIDKWKSKQVMLAVQNIDSFINETIKVLAGTKFNEIIFNILSILVEMRSKDSTRLNFDEILKSYILKP